MELKTIFITFFFLFFFKKKKFFCNLSLGVPKINDLVKVENILEKKSPAKPKIGINFVLPEEQLERL